MRFIATVAALSAVATTAQAAKAWVYNHCSTPIYLWAVDVNRNPSAATEVPAGGSWSEDYRTPTAGGVSIKLAKTSSASAITQFEYTLNSAAIWYDGSNINCIAAGCPFQGQNLLIKASKSTCPARSCSKSDSICTGFYNIPTDDTATLSCDPTADTEFHVCLPDDQMPGGSSTPATAVATLATVATRSTSTAASTRTRGPRKVVTVARRHLVDLIHAI